MSERIEPIMLRPVELEARRPNMAAIVAVAIAVARRRAERKMAAVEPRRVA